MKSLFVLVLIAIFATNWILISKAEAEVTCVKPAKEVRPEMNRSDI